LSDGSANKEYATRYSKVPEKEQKLSAQCISKIAHHRRQPAMSSKNQNQQAPKPPKEWPTEVVQLYDPVRTLGVGGFASVELARKKSPGPNEEKFVAMKIVGSKDGVTRSELGYARRETDILKEISHPNIMKVVSYWEPEQNSKSAAVMALGYARGPTLESLLQHGGALSSTFGRIVIAQVIDAVSCLHSHAVVHRYLKPDNIVVTGASSKQDEVWDNEIPENGSSSFEDLRKKWHVTLIDFGFARALTPEDVANPSDQIRKENQEASYSPEDLDRQEQSSWGFMKTNYHKNLDSSTHSLDKSISRKFVRKMSAVGNRNFCAPEIMEDMTDDLDTEKKTTLTSSSKASITETLSTCVSEYGLMVDAYSLGYTFRYMMTGARPPRLAEDALAEQKSLARRFSRWAKKKISSKSLTRKKRYRLESDLPMEAQMLLLNLTERLERNRMSVRAARRSCQWIADVLPKMEEEDTKTLQVIGYLKCALAAKYPAPPASIEPTGPMVATVA
jgi:serine/threonine protein kinase